MRYEQSGKLEITECDCKLGRSTQINKASTNDLNFIIGKIKHTVKRIKKFGIKNDLEEDEA